MSPIELDEVRARIRERALIQTGGQDALVYADREALFKHVLTLESKLFDAKMALEREKISHRNTRQWLDAAIRGEPV